MILKLASASDLEEIVKLRKQVFVNELGVQDENYQDVFNDYFSKNLIVVQNQHLLGAIRVAFHRETQRFYISYVVLKSSKRNKTLGALLLGGMLRIMEENGIQTIYADSHKEVVNQNLKFGCEVIGPPFYKYGFACEWIPLRYCLSNTTSSGNWMLERARPFLSAIQCRWDFPVHIVLCHNIHEYESCLYRLIATCQIFGTFPLLSTTKEPLFVEWGSTHLVTAGAWCEQQPSSFEPEGKRLFEKLNSCVSNRHLLVTKRDSPLLPIAKCYAMLTGKRLQVVDDFSQLLVDEETQSIFALMTNCEQSPEDLGVLSQWAKMFALGIQISNMAEECSINLLRSYVYFTQPQTESVVFHSINFSVAVGSRPANEIYRHLDLEHFSYGTNPIDDWSPAFAASRTANNQSAELLLGERLFASFRDSHFIVQMGERADEDAERSRCEALLYGGFSFGDTVRFLNDEFSNPPHSRLFLLFGDPALQVAEKSLPVAIPSRLF
jgi:predicted GNAT family N-acyltransferase